MITIREITTDNYKVRDTGSTPETTYRTLTDGLTPDLQGLIDANGVNNTVVPEPAVTPAPPNLDLPNTWTAPQTTTAPMNVKSGMNVTSPDTLTTKFVSISNAGKVHIGGDEFVLASDVTSSNNDADGTKVTNVDAVRGMIIKELQDQSLI